VGAGRSQQEEVGGGTHGDDVASSWEIDVLLVADCWSGGPTWEVEAVLEGMEVGEVVPFNSDRHGRVLVCRWVTTKVNAKVC
jgi:hypothetical protein